MAENTSNNLPEEQSKKIDFKSILFYYLSYWKWFIASVLLFLAISFLYLRYSTPIYRSSTIIMLKDDYRGGGVSESASFSEIGLFKGT